MAMNVLALTPLLERFESEYGTLTALALFMGRKFPFEARPTESQTQADPRVCNSLFDPPGPSLHPYTKLCPPRQHASHGRQRVVLSPPRHGSDADVPHQSALCDRNVQYSHVDDAIDAGSRGLGLGAELELVGPSVWVGGRIHMYENSPVSFFH